MNKPSQDFQFRYDEAKAWRDGIRPQIEDVYKFCAPGREFDFTRTSKTVTEPQIFHGLGEEAATDLAGDIVTYFTPSEARWASYAVVSEVEESDADTVLRLIQKREQDLFQLISQSNYNDIAPMWGFETATHGTPGLWISKGALAQAIHCEVVPPDELLITPGHMGILDRFREVSVRASTLKVLLDNDSYPIDLSDNAIKMMMEKPGAMAKVCWGFWVDWSDPNRPMWRTEVTVNGKRVTPAEPPVLGDLAGSCPLMVGRFNPQPKKPWGRGPGIKTLLDLRVLDTIDELMLSALDQSLLNTIIYPSDGFIDMGEGLVPGKAYPAHRGFTRDQVWEMPKQANLETNWFTEDRFEDRIRRGFYQDGPRQRGDTPPTATQWVDERRRVQQRIGKPSAPIWSEFVKPLIQRFEYLGVLSGELPEAVSHNERDILITPISPLQKAQNNDKVLITRSNLEMAFNTLQDQTGSVVDMVKTFQNIVTASGDELMVVRQQQEAPLNEAPPQAQ